MAPLTRNRALPRQTPTSLMTKYYEQRAAAGLIVSEATQISPEGQGYLDTPGIHSPEQLLAWRAVTDAVHRNRGKIVCQLWHVGRISHVSAPRALRLDEIPRIVADFRRANGYLLEQFLRNSINDRVDAYGG